MQAGLSLAAEDDFFLASDADEPAPTFQVKLEMPLAIRAAEDP